MKTKLSNNKTNLVTNQKLSLKNKKQKHQDGKNDSLVNKINEKKPGKKKTA